MKNSKENSSSVRAGQGYDLKQIPVDSVKRPELELRYTADEQGMEQLRLSIAERGVLVPLFVREVDDGYELIAGSRRLACAAAVGLATVPAIVVGGDAEESAWVTMAENLHREGINAVDEAHYIAAVLERWNLSQTQAAERLGVKLDWLKQRLGLLNWPEDVRNAVRERWISFAVGREFVGIKSEGVRRQCIDTARRAGCTVRHAAIMRRNWAKDVQGATVRLGTEVPEEPEDSAEFGLACILCDKVTAREDGTIVFLCTECGSKVASLPSGRLKNGSGG